MILLLTCAVIGVILLTLFAENGEFGWSLFTFLGFLAVLFFVDKRVSINDVYTFAREHVGYVIAGAIVYIMTGVLWCLLKWKWFCRTQYRLYGPREDVKASYNKARLTGWMVWWPLSFAWFIVHDPITKFYNFLYDRLSTMFDAISKSEKERIKMH